MKAVTLVAIVAITMLITGCQGFLGLDYDSKHYVVGSQHEVKSVYLAGKAQNDGQYTIVVGKNGDKMKSWVERDGKFVDPYLDVCRLLPNPWWPFPHRTAIAKGTPRELGLYDIAGDKRGHRWLMSIESRHRIVSHYSECVSRWGKDNVTLATNDRALGGKRYWLEVVVDGKRFSRPVEGVYRQHYQSYNPYGDGYVVQWRGALDEYEALAGNEPNDPAQAKAAADSLKQIPGTYWIHENRHIFRLLGTSNL